MSRKRRLLYTGAISRGGNRNDTRRQKTMGVRKSTGHEMYTSDQAYAYVQVLCVCYLPDVLNFEFRTERQSMKEPGYHLPCFSAVREARS